MIDAVQHAIENAVTMKGCTTRRQYWMFMLANFLFGFTMGILLGILEAMGMAQAASALNIGFLVMQLPLIVICFTMVARRLHDSGRSAWNMLWYLIPLAGLIVWIVQMTRPSKLENNPYRLSDVASVARAA